MDYLSTLGFEPVKIRGNDYWYLSPLRQERTPSFKINLKLNRWYDHGLGQGGNLVDFGILFYGCTVSDFVKTFNAELSLHQPAFLQPHKSVIQAPERQIKIVNEIPLTSPHLLRYLQHRRIDVEVSETYCREVHYKLAGKTYYGIGFRNDLGGFEIRNPYLKISSSPKGITTFQNNAEEVIVFEGFMDFLSFKTIHQKWAENRYDFLVLNSVAFLKSARAFMENHHRILLYLDRDKTGQNCSRYALSLSSRYEDHSNLYRPHKDFNEWLMNFGKAGQSPFLLEESLEDDLKTETQK